MCVEYNYIEYKRTFVYFYDCLSACYQVLFLSVCPSVSLSLTLKAMSEEINYNLSLIYLICINSTSFFYNFTFPFLPFPFASSCVTWMSPFFPLSGCISPPPHFPFSLFTSFRHSLALYVNFLLFPLKLSSIHH